jgi:dipeptidyl aminopeptidase/acylaminoacyl peptidase
MDVMNKIHDDTNDDDDNNNNNNHNNHNIVQEEYDSFTTNGALPQLFHSVRGGTTSATNHYIYMIGGGYHTPTGIYQWNLQTPQQPAIRLVSSSSHNSTAVFPTSVLSTPQHIEFPTSNERTAFGYYYPPKNDSYISTKEHAPPLLVKAHGGK